MQSYFWGKKHLNIYILFWIVATVVGIGPPNCGSVNHIFVHNTTEGIEVLVASPLTHTSVVTLVAGVYLPAECGYHSRCNVTAIRPEVTPDELLNVYVPAVGSLVVLTYSYNNTGLRWNLTNSTVLPMPGACSPLTIGLGAGPELDIICVSGSAVYSLVLTLSDWRITTLDSMVASGSIYAPLLIASNANCPLVGSVANTVVFLDSTSVVITAFAATAPNVFTRLKYGFISSACPLVGGLEYYGSGFLLRCSAASAFTFDPCHQSLRPVTNYSGSVPYPCSSWGVVAWMSPANNTVFVAYQNGTVTASIAIGRVSEASCVNPRDPYFVYRNVNGSVYAVRIQDGSVTTLGTSWCSWPASSPVSCSGLDFTEQEGSFLVGFIDGSVYKVVNLSCPSGPPTVVGLPFLPDLSTSFVGPDQQSCSCFPLVPTSSSSTGSSTFPSLPQLPSPGSSSTSNILLSPSNTLAQTQTSRYSNQVIGGVCVGTVALIAITAFLMIIIIIICKNKRKKQLQHARTEESQTCGNSRLVRLGHVPSSRSSITNSSSEATFELGPGITARVECSNEAVSGSGGMGTTSSGMETICSRMEIGYGGMETVNGGMVTAYDGMETGYGSDRPVMPSADYYGMNLSDATAQTPVCEESIVPQVMSMATGVHLLAIGVHDVVEKDSEGMREDRRNDMDSKVAALGTHQ